MAVIIPEGIAVGVKEYRQYAASVAAMHKVIKRDGSKRYLPDINQYRVIVENFYNRIINEKAEAAMPVEEWIADNYHIVSEQFSNVSKWIEQSRKNSFKDIPVIKGYAHESNGVLRIYKIACHIVDAVDGQIDESSVIEFIEEYQNTISLTSSEICVLGEMLRVALLCRIAQLCENAEKIHNERNEAKRTFERFVEYIDDEKDASSKKRAIDVWLSSTEELTPILAETILRLAAGMKGDTGEFRRILEMKLAGRSTSIDKMLSSEKSMRTSMGVSCGNAIQSLNRLGAFDWDTVNSQLSTVERILETDPSGIYSEMDRDSRSYYVRCVENIARRIDVSGEAVARTAIEEAAKNFQGDKNEKSGHVGYYLCDKGTAAVYKALKHRFHLYMPKRPRGAAAAATFMAAAATLASVMSFAASVIIIRNIANMWDSVLVHVVLSILTVVPCIILFMNISVSIVQWIFAKTYKPLVLPAMDFSLGIPDEYSTFFVMPVLMKNGERVKEIMSELEIISLANRDKNIYFAVVADSGECDDEHAKYDAEVNETGIKEAMRLNKKYGIVQPDGTIQNRFFYFHRSRKWHNCEGKWIGRERKRGALIDFNALVTGRDDHNLLGMTKNVPNVRFVMTVDADTRITNDTIRKMAAVMAHPLNLPNVAYSGGCAYVESGYGILQPAVMTEPVRKRRTLFAEIYTGEVGIDAYFARNSDFYFDACLEGIYTGKGMYDPAVFNLVAENTFRDETVLSHDLLEGSYMRTAFTSNITIYDGFPKNYSAYIKRQHRWIRGDWQLLPYRRMKFVNRLGRKVESPLNFLSLYKITNNLQRSLAAPAAVILFAVGMFFMRELAFLWYAVLAGYVFLPFLMSPSVKSLKKCFCELCFLPHEAYMSLDACIRTLWRISVSHKHLLQWVTAADAEKNSANSVSAYFKMMWPCLVVGVIIHDIFGMLWIVSPYIAWRLGKISTRDSSIGADENLIKNDENRRAEIMALSRRMWAFYEEYAADNSFLPPDNVQFSPEHKVAERTSPTNIGFYILCTALSSRLGFITLSDAVFYIDNTLNTMDKMDKWNGHLLNWYSTKSLEPLMPAFVSTVDNGNLAVCMVTASVLLSNERKRYESDIKGVIKSRFDGIKAIERIIREEYAPNDLKGLYLPENFDGGSDDEWKNLLKHCISFCVNFEHTERVKDKEFEMWIKRFRVTCETYLEDDVYVCETKHIVERLNNFAYSMDFSLLYDRKKGCFSTGYIVRDNRQANSYYDVAVSEARLSVYFAIAKGDVPPEAFFRPARRFLKNGKGVIRSWSGTAFEYLLPELFFRPYPGLMWDTTTELMIDSQKNYCAEKGLPWGISESGYNMRDVNLNYKYKAFGVPELGMHREKDSSIVVAPYASIMAIEHAPDAVFENMKKLKGYNAFGNFGFYEAVDFTDGRKGVVASYMAHHVGMAFAGCANYLENGIVGEAFSSVPDFMSCELLLAERSDKNYGKIGTQYGKNVKTKSVDSANTVAESKDKPYKDETYFVPLVYDGRYDMYPSVYAISNGESSLLVNEEGKSELSVRDILVSAGDGLRFYIRECNSDTIWSGSLFPIYKNECDGENYRALFYPERVLFCRDENDYKSELHICISGEDDTQVCRLEITNGGNIDAVFEITVFTELAVCRRTDFEAHRAYQDIKLVTSAEHGQSCIRLYADRVYRSSSKENVSAFMSVWADRPFIGAVTYDTDTTNFIGNNGTLKQPAAIYCKRPLGGKTGAVLTPCFAARGRIKAAPGDKAVFYTALGAATGYGAAAQEKNMTMARHYDGARAAARAFSMAYTNATIEKETANLNAERLEAYSLILQQIKNSEICGLKNSVAIENSSSIVPVLWKFGISGDLPILTADISYLENIKFIESAVDAWQFLQGRGIYTDLVILVNENEGYITPIYSYAENMSAQRVSMSMPHKGNIHVIQVSQYQTHEVDCIYAAASCMLKPVMGNRAVVAVKPSKESQLRKVKTQISSTKEISLKDISEIDKYETNNIIAMYKNRLVLENGYGGFEKESGSYVILKTAEVPAPWVNCITSYNGDLGFTISTKGGGCTWHLNSHEYRLTPWSSNPAYDEPNEIIYVKNETLFIVSETETKRTIYNHICVPGLFTATPMMLECDKSLNDRSSVSSGEYVTEHGFGYSRFTTVQNGISSKLTVFAHGNKSVKISVLEIKNEMNTDAEISLAYFARPVMGEHCRDNEHFIGTKWDKENCLLVAENHRKHGAFSSKMFMGCSLVPDSYTGNENEFIGIKGDLNVPAAMADYSSYLSDTCGYGLKPCMAIKNSLTIKSGATVSVIYFLGCGDSSAEFAEIVQDLKSPYNAQLELTLVRKLWNDFFNAIHVDTPDNAMNFMVNFWLPYQVKSCRFDGRTAFYQSGGAYGFRDQIQDCLAILHNDPNCAKEHILLCASRQYEEGDVQHWWHPPENAGVRTRYSDDLLWLPYAVYHYVEFTGDTSILHENVKFLRSEPLKPSEHDRYEIALVSDKSADLYTHCELALKRAMEYGSHGIPLMNGGDWNDGMNKVGENGGESVWLGWFLCTVIPYMQKLAEYAGKRCEYKNEVYNISKAIEENAWDGDRYMRAFYGDGTPLGASSCAECSIDSLSQSWSVISGVADKKRAHVAIETAYINLVDRERGIIRLLTPAFEGNSDKNPGYISDYPSGIRENAAQYTHAAIWLAKAFFEDGQPQRGYELLSMINPINHSRTEHEANIYKTEPYAVAADVYYGEPNYGRGGWTWYTGAAGWLYRCYAENLLGIRKYGNVLEVNPAIPAEWHGRAELTYRYGSRKYRIDLSKGRQRIQLL